MLNHKTIFKQKSKILLIIISIFGLAFSYSCSCRSPQDGRGGYDEKEFSASVSGTVQDTLRVDSQSQKKAGTEDIKISFSAAKGVNTVENFAVTIEKVEVKEGGLELGTNADDYKNYLRYDKSTGTIQFEQKGLQAIGALSSATAPVDKIVSITFKIDGGEQGSDYITRDFHLIKIKKIEEESINDILHKILDTAKHVFSNGDVYNPKNTNLQLNSGNYSTGVYTIENTGDSLGSFTAENVTDIMTVANYYIPRLDEIKKIDEASREGGNGQKYYSVKFSITWGDNFESNINDITFKYIMEK